VSVRLEDDLGRLLGKASAKLAKTSLANPNERKIIVFATEIYPRLDQANQFCDLNLIHINSVAKSNLKLILKNNNNNI